MPFTEGRTIVGWGVVRLDPWDFDAIYPTREEAEAEAEKLGPDYRALWGENQEGTDNFIFAESPDATGDRRVTEDGDYLVTEDGDPIVTEDGSPIRLESGTDDGPKFVEVPPGWPSDIPPDEYLSAQDSIGVSDEVEAEIVRPAARWTGIASRTARLVELRGQLDVAQAAVDFLIDELADADGNGGPLLDEHIEALEALRNLHHALGQLIHAVDRGTLNDELGDGLVAEIIRYGARAVEALRKDPARFVLSATIYGTFSACGHSDLGGALSALAASIRRAKE
jgi:hypothetical protein